MLFVDSLVVSALRVYVCIVLCLISHHKDKFAYLFGQVDATSVRTEIFRLLILRIS